MASLPPAQQGILAPPELRDGKDGQKQAYILINWLRRRVMGGGGPGTGLALFSTALGRGDSTTTSSGNEDAFILQWQLPAVVPAFAFSMGGMLSSALGNATVRARLGGSYNAFDGTVIATITGNSATLADVSTTGNAVSANTNTLLKLTLQASGAGHKATWVAGFAIGN